MIFGKADVKIIQIRHVSSKPAKVIAACRYVHRDRRNEFLKYNYASAATILEKVNAACVDQNLAIIIVSKILSRTEKTSCIGAIETMVTIQTDITIVDCKSGEMLTFTGPMEWSGCWRQSSCKG